MSSPESDAFFFNVCLIGFIAFVAMFAFFWWLFDGIGGAIMGTTYAWTFFMVCCIGAIPNQEIGSKVTKVIDKILK